MNAHFVNNKVYEDKSKPFRDESRVNAVYENIAQE